MEKTVLKIFLSYFKYLMNMDFIIAARRLLE